MAGKKRPPGATPHPTEDELEREREEHDRRVRNVMRLMCNGQWYAGASHQKLAHEYGVAISTVKGYAAQASRMLRMLRGDEDEIREEILVGIAHCHQVALTKEDPDVKAALAALELRGKFLGLLVNKTQQVPVPREEMLATVRNWFLDPSPELESLLEECGWRRIGTETKRLTG